ncbi:hypothetical conserved protein [Candidatus Nitrosoglobus terrae]|uniref:Hypothetical conserved protein n=1 Tax=Candidatus Nitrosoglobus terrae TaxID=1630141 RepID=A0A1Q2SKW7_9GAMM|nr:hypothetical protein [Candidatus Nitrosoglobus terrae]BAW79795.1 hypothetical conserved protein [Candidatus Nitrosoglobus terrae]
MPDYSLQLLIDEKDLPVIKGAGQYITLAKPVNSNSPNVIWLSVDPFSSTEVSWQEQYGIYASTTAVQQGATITKLSETGIPAQDGAYYTLSASAVFTGPYFNESVPAGTWAAQNSVPYSQYQSLTFGLSQSALVNQKPINRKPLSAASVLANQSIEMTPFTNIYVWLQAVFSSETIISRIIGKYTIARFGNGVNNITLKYEPNLGVFVPYTNGQFQRESSLVTLNLPLVA